MQTYLILCLSGPMQAWGVPTFESARFSAPFPGRSGLLGLLGACLGIKRNNMQALQRLSDSVHFAVRCDEQAHGTVNTGDFHTIKEAREKQGGLKKHDTIITRREYLYDARFTVAVWTLVNAGYSLPQCCEAVQKPIYTPYLGRRSCPLSQPLFQALQPADNPVSALEQGAPGHGIIYSEEPLTGNEHQVMMRDEPLIRLRRQFGRHSWFLIQGASPCF
ncbi:type I-E CRISPR-associated protein Cas5/CasD [Enterobacteriaceae bacterium LUAb1]